MSSSGIFSGTAHRYYGGISFDPVKAFPTVRIVFSQEQFIVMNSFLCAQSIERDDDSKCTFKRAYMKFTSTMLAECLDHRLQLSDLSVGLEFNEPALELAIAFLNKFGPTPDPAPTAAAVESTPRPTSRIAARSNKILADITALFKTEIAKLQAATDENAVAMDALLRALPAGVAAAKKSGWLFS